MRSPGCRAEGLFSVGCLLTGKPQKEVALPAGFEPAALRLGGECSILLSYGSSVRLFGAPKPRAGAALLQGPGASKGAVLLLDPPRVRC